MTVRVAVKDAPRGRWRTVEAGLSFGEAIDAVADHATNAYEVGILGEAGPVRGVILWTSAHPDVANDVRG